MLLRMQCLFSARFFLSVLFKYFSLLLFEHFDSKSEETGALCEKCLYSKFSWSVFSRIRTEYGEILRISPYLPRMWENMDQRNSKYGHVSRSSNNRNNLNFLSLLELASLFLNL